MASSGKQKTTMAKLRREAKLREQRVTAPFALDRMLPFWALVFNLRELAQDIKQLASTVPQLA